MRHYVGIDLGTTNSAICSFDGEEVTLYKSPEQTDVTPSAIFYDKRGNKFVGARAYTNAARNPGSAATLFKRMIGTNTPINLPDIDKVLTPEECAAEILRVLHGYLPTEIHQDSTTGTVITVPSAFNQMQKNATNSAAESAGLGNVALMQEPVAAVMSVMRKRKADGVFLIFDLGGGTLDIAIAESIAGRVSLLSQGGIEMCGGRDFDRRILTDLVEPWLHANFDLPEELYTQVEFKRLERLATWAAEKAKIELSQTSTSVINLSESEIGARDRVGKELYVDVPLSRDAMNDIISPLLTQSISAAIESMAKAGISANDVERIVFVGGPTIYEPLREKVAAELGIAGSTDVNPMTAVAEGAAVFAESIEWKSSSRGRKKGRGTVNAGSDLQLSFNYVARTPGTTAKIGVKVASTSEFNAELQIDSLDTGWSSGRAPLKDGSIMEVALSKSGENTFKIFVFDATGSPVQIQEDKIVIVRTAAAIDAIPASSSIGIETLNKLGGLPVLEFLIREGDALPKSGQTVFKAVQSLRAGSAESINFKIWEGDITDVIADNLWVGALSITGADFEEGVIAAGADLICDYELLDSGGIVLEVSVPSIGGVFHSGRNFYSRKASQIDFSDAARLVHEDADDVRDRIDHVAEKVDDPKLNEAARKLDEATSLSADEENPDLAKHAMDSVLSAKKLLAQVRKSHLRPIRQMDLDNCVAHFNEGVRQFARPTEVTSFENLTRTAQRAIDNDSADFDTQIDEMRAKNFQILWRQDWFVVNWFKRLAEDSYLFPDKQQHTSLVSLGMTALKSDDMDKLRHVVAELNSLRFGSGSADDMMATVNIVKG